MSFLPNFCRLCLQKFTGPFEILSGDLKASSMLKNLFPGMNTDLVEKSKICIECFKYIQFSYTMRETVIKNEQKINSNMVSIRNVEENTCRLCLNTRISEGTVFLYENNKQTMSSLEARSIIEIAIVTMHFEIFRKPVVCNCCWKIIRLIYLFKKRCFATEKILKFYCTKNNLLFLSNNDIESVSICYNSNLQKFSKGDELNLLANLVPKENIENTSQTTLSSVYGIIKPVDVYLNNFTSEEEDDVFDEEVDDIFIESPKIVKAEPSDTLTEVIKEEEEEQNTNSDQRGEDLKQLDEAAKEIKREEARNLNNTPTDIPEKDVQGIIVKNSPGKQQVINNNFKGLNKSFMEVTISAKSTERFINESDSEKLESRAESSKVQNDTSSISKDTEIIPEENNIKMINCSSEYNPLRNFDSHSIETQNKTIEQSVQKAKALEHNKKGLKKSANLDDKDLRELVRNNGNSPDPQQETIKHTRKRKKPFEKSEDFVEPSKNNSEDNQKEMLEPIINKLRKKSEYVESIKVTAKLEKKIKKTRINKHEKKSKKSIELIGKKMEKDDGETEWHCNECEFKTKYRQHLRRHHLIHNKNGEMMACAHCVYSTYIKRNLERHMLVHTSENFLQCAHCTYLTLTRHHLKRHMLTHQESNNTKSIDPKEYRYNTDLDTVTQKKTLGFGCRECPFVTSKEGQITAHIRTHRSQEKILKCTECHYITTRTHSIKDHMELHNKNSSKCKTFKCKLCSFTGKRHTHLISHMLTHETEFKFNCSRCNYQAKRKSHLVTHMLRHQSGDKKIMFQCPHCKYKSIRKEHLKSHLRNMHPGKEEVNCNEVQVAVENDDDGSIKEKKTARCPYCPYRYHTPNQQIVHIFTGHFPSESKEMHCNDCSYKTDTRKLFMRHLYNVHRSKSRKK